MKWLVFLPVMLLFLSNSWSAESDLKPFCQNLDKSLRALNSPSPIATCPAKSEVLTGKPITYKGKDTTLLTPQEAQDLFKDMASQEHIAFKFPVDGCFDRADEMSRLMIKKGIKPLKGFLWIEPSNPKEVENGGSPLYKHYLQYPNENNPKEPWQWHDHVAPIVIVEEKGKQIPYVIDPSTENKAVPMEVWKKKLSKHDKKIKVSSEIGRTGQYNPGSPYDVNYQDPAFVARLQERIAKYKAYEQSKTGLEDYMGDQLWERDDYEGKIDAMSGGK